MAFRMYKEALSFDAVYESMQAIRDITSPNIGLVAQHNEWEVSQSGCGTPLPAQHMLERAATVALVS